MFGSLFLRQSDAGKMIMKMLIFLLLRIFLLLILQAATQQNVQKHSKSVFDQFLGIDLKG